MPVPEPRANAGAAGWLAAGGLAGALLASSCCIVPLGLVFLGVSGAWIGRLTALEPYRPIFATLALVPLALAGWRIYIRPTGACATRITSVATRAVFWTGTSLVVLAMTVGLWAPLLY